MTYRLTRKARSDLIHIYGEGVRLFGVAQAETYQDQLERTFDLLADNPRIARERDEIRPPVRIHPSGAHVVVNTTDEIGVLIIRVRHGLEDWASDPF